MRGGPKHPRSRGTACTIVSVFTADFKVCCNPIEVCGILADRVDFHSQALDALKERFKPKGKEEKKGEQSGEWTSSKDDFSW